MRVIVGIFLFVSCVSCQYTEDALKDEISNLPGAPSVPFRMFSGYIKVAPTRKLFYWFTESQAATASKDPVMLWTNGGPGCSGLSGFLTENGPFRPLVNGSGLRMNQYSWNKIANTIFIEQPAGVGFSTIDDPDYKYNDAEAAADNLAFIRGWFAKYPQYKSNRFYITSESYGGHYLPTLAYELLVNGTDVTNFKGFAVGNPLTWLPYRNFGQFGTWADHQLLPRPLWLEYLENKCVPPNVSDATAFRDAPFKSSDVCGSLEDTMSTITEGMNPYALDFPTCLPATTGRRERLAMSRTIERANRAAEQTTDKKKDITQVADYFPNYIPCEDSWAGQYLHRSDVIEAIHAVSPAGGWQECSDPINEGWSQKDLNAPMMEYYQKLVASGKKYDLLIYSGDDDSVCATLGTQQFIWDLGLAITKPWAQWKDGDDQIAGFHVQFEGLHFATVHGAGHMCPSTRPAQTLDLLQKFLNNTW